jgi:predicted transcriptional regulator
MALGKDQSTMCRTLRKLKTQKLVEELADKWKVTPKGKRALKDD